MTNSLIDYTSMYTYEFILDRALSRVSDTLDKRQGSIIYDALAPACMELANSYVELQSIINQTFALTAEGDYLDLRVAEASIVRYPASKAIRLGVFTNTDGTPATLTIGDRFSTIDDETITFFSVYAAHEVDDVVVPGSYQMQCETEGIVGNNYVGNIVPVDYIDNLGSALLSDILIAGEDEETNNDLRLRYFESLRNRAFGGNIAHYRQWCQEIEGVGPVQVYPTWNGGGTVKLSILSSDYEQASGTLIDNVQESLDPDNMDGDPVTQGNGLGTAPIGHVVTVVTPSELTINISATIVLKNGYIKATVDASIEENLEAYFLERRQSWGTSDDKNVYLVGVYLAMVSSIILNTTGVENVTNVLLNGSAADIVLTENSTTQQIPILGTVTTVEA